MPANKASKSLEKKLLQVRTSGKMRAITAYILGVRWTSPYIITLSVTSDGFVIVRPSYNGELGHEEMIGSSDDLRRNLAGLASVAELTGEEMRELNRLYEKKVDDWQMLV